MEEEVTLFPICAWSIGPIKMYESVAIKLEFLTSALQKRDEANETPNFTLTVDQALLLSNALQLAVHELQSAEVQAAPGQRH